MTQVNTIQKEYTFETQGDEGLYILRLNPNRCWEFNDADDAIFAQILLNKLEANGFSTKEFETMYHVVLRIIMNKHITL